MITPEKKNTGEFIKYPNGNVMSIYSQLTKRGIRYYRYFRGRFQIIGRVEIDQLIHIAN
jgi:hypothetical protein